MDTDDPRILGTFVMIPKRKAAKLSQSNRSDHPMTSRQVAWWHATWAQFTDLGFREAVTGFVCAGENKSIGSTRTCSTRPVVQRLHRARRRKLCAGWVSEFNKTLDATRRPGVMLSRYLYLDILLEFLQIF